MKQKSGFLSTVENSRFVRAVRGGLVAVIPISMVGAFALVLRSFPIPSYQTFIRGFASGMLYNIFDFVNKATLGMLSLYMTAAVGSEAAKQSKHRINNAYGAPVAAATAFLISVGFLGDSFELSSLSAVGMFAAIICGTSAAALYIRIDKAMGMPKIFSDGADPAFNRSISMIIPLSATAITYALANLAISALSDSPHFFGLLTLFFNNLFDRIGGGFLGGFVYIALSNLLWFFGIHGSDLLETVNANVFTPAIEANAAAVAAGAAPTEIFTKTFFDVFVLMGGCGSLLALLAALLIFSRRKSCRSLAGLSALPMLFNINETMVFGLPIVFNHVMLIPFVAAPVTSFLISAAATYLGIVPITTVPVEWTTPIILGGYQSTGSAAGSLLQLFNLAVSIAIYAPFVRIYDRKKEADAIRSIGMLVDVLKESEKHNTPISLTEYDGLPGDVAKQLVNDLRRALDSDELFMNYQPQFAYDGAPVGAEALLRWKHPSFGMIYPPLIVKIAHEADILGELERYIFARVKADMEQSGAGGKISINATAVSMHDPKFVDYLKDLFPDSRAGNATICIEITEQSELVTDDRIRVTLDNLRHHGFMLAIDDFSMGFTSLKYLQESSFDLVKLDGSLVRGLSDGSRAADIISSIVYLSQSLGFSVLAEFVETEEQRDMLAGIGCLIYQGYLYSPPLSLDGYAKIVNDNDVNDNDVNDNDVNDNDVDNNDVNDNDVNDNDVDKDIDKDPQGV